MKRILILKSIFLIFILSSCAVHNGGQMLNFEARPESSVFVRTVNVNSDRAVYLLGIGGLFDRSLLNEAKEKLLAHKLKKGERIANISFEYKTTNLLLIQTRRIELTADVLIDKKELSMVTPEEYKTIAKSEKTFGEFKVGDKVFYKAKVLNSTEKGTILDFENGKAKILKEIDGESVVWVPVELLRH